VRYWDSRIWFSSTVRRIWPRSSANDLYDQQYLATGESPVRGVTRATTKAGFAFRGPISPVFTFKQFLYQAGGQLFNDSNEPTFVEEGVEVLEFFDQLRERNIIPESGRGWDR